MLLTAMRCPGIQGLKALEVRFRTKTIEVMGETNPEGKANTDIIVGEKSYIKSMVRECVV